MKQFFIYILLLIFSFNANAQIKMIPALEQKLEGKKKLYDIQREVEKFYNEEKSKLRPADSIARKGMNRQLKMWNRFFYEASSHLNSDGEVENMTQRIWDVVQNLNSNIESSTAFGDWQPIGPTYVDDGIGRVNRIAFHPTDANTIYIGTARGGLWKTLDGGNNWGCISQYIPSLGISGIVVDKNTPQTVYVLTGDGDTYTGGFVKSFGYISYSVGVLKSVDGGATWAKTGDLPLDPSIQYTGYNLVQCPVNTNILLAATSHGLFKTIDGGDHWFQSDMFTIGAADNIVRVWDVAFKPGSATEAYCTVLQDDGSLFLRSTDGGTSFLSSSTVNFSPNTFNSGAQRIKIGVTPSGSNNVVYLLAGPADVEAQTFKGIWKSTDAGHNFSRQSSTPDILGYQDILNDFANQNRYDLALAVDPGNTARIITGGLVVWRSENSGVDMDEIVDYFPDLDNSNYIHPDVHDLAYNPLDGKLWAASDGGISVSTDDGDSWVRRYNGLQISAFYHFEPDNEDGKRWGGTQDCGILEQVSGNFYDKFDGGDGFDVMTDKAPAGNNNDSYWVVNKTIRADGGVLVDVTPDGVDEYFPNLDMSPNNEDILYAGFSKLYISLDRGDNYDSVLYIEPGVSGYYVPGNWAISSCRSNPTRFYSAGLSKDTNNLGERYFGMFRIADANTASPTATKLHIDPSFTSGMKITDIAVSTSNSTNVWITVGGFFENNKVWYSTDAGLNWTNMSGSLPNLPVNCILLVDDDVYIGTDIGVYYRNSASADWTPFYNRLPRVPITELFFINRDVGGTTYSFIEASTFGRGLWQTEAFTACDAILNVTQNFQGPHFLQAGAVLSSTSITHGGVGTNVVFQAGSYIYLEPGFHAQAGTEFDTKLAPCNSGVPGKIIPIEKRKKEK